MVKKEINTIKPIKKDTLQMKLLLILSDLNYVIYLLYVFCFVIVHLRKLTCLQKRGYNHTHKLKLLKFLYAVSTWGIFSYNVVVLVKK